MHFTVFLVLPKKLHLAIALEPIISKDHDSVLSLLFKESGMTSLVSLFSSHYSGRNGKAQDNIKTKDYFSNMLG